MLTLNLFVNLAQIFNELLLLGIFAKHGREVFTQGADDIRVDLREAIDTINQNLF